MPTWNEIDSEIDAKGGDAKACDEVRSKYLAALGQHLNRPVIAYYSGFLQRKNPDGRTHPEAVISDHDTNGFMAVIHGLERKRGVDLILHTPGGDIEATRAIVEYLYKMFGRNIRAIVPQIAMSAGTMIACAAKTITLAKHSCLGPTDPHINGMPAMGVIAEAERAIQEIKAEPLKQIVWQQVFAKYPPGFILNCERAIAGTKTMVRDWLKQGMLSGEPDPEVAADEAIRQLMDYDGTSGHGHHFMSDKCKGAGLKIVDLEADQSMQELVLSVHHAFMATFSRAKVLKIVENSDGSRWAVNG